MPAVHFEVFCEAPFGSRVLVVGSTAALGLWDPRRSTLELTTDVDTYPWWVGAQTWPSGSDVQFKFVILGRAGDTKWEDSIANRLLTVFRADARLKLYFNSVQVNCDGACGLMHQNCLTLSSLEEQVAEAERRLAEVEERAAEAENRAAAANRAATEAEERAADAERRASAAKLSAAVTEERAAAAERKLAKGGRHAAEVLKGVSPTCELDLEALHEDCADTSTASVSSSLSTPRSPIREESSSSTESRHCASVEIDSVLRTWGQAESQKGRFALHTRKPQNGYVRKPPVEPDPSSRPVPPFWMPPAPVAPVVSQVHSVKGEYAIQLLPPQSGRATIASQQQQQQGTCRDFTPQVTPSRSGPISSPTAGWQRPCGMRGELAPQEIPLQLEPRTASSGMRRRQFRIPFGTPQPQATAPSDK